MRYRPSGNRWTCSSPGSRADRTRPATTSSENIGYDAATGECLDGANAEEEVVRDMDYRVILTADQVRYALKLGFRRQHESERQGLKGKHGGATTGDRAMANHYLGA